MSSEKNLSLAKNFLETLGAGASAFTMAELCTPDLEWNIPGDTGVLPWVGQKTGRDAIFEFVRDTQTMIQRESLDIHDVLASDERAVILGHLRTRITATGKLITGDFAIVLRFSGNLVSHFLMLEDSYATSVAAKVDDFVSTSSAQPQLEDASQ